MSRACLISLVRESDRITAIERAGSSLARPQPIGKRDISLAPPRCRGPSQRQRIVDHAIARHSVDNDPLSLSRTTGCPVCRGLRRSRWHFNFCRCPSCRWMPAWGREGEKASPDWCDFLLARRWISGSRSSGFRWAASVKARHPARRSRRSRLDQAAGATGEAAGRRDHVIRATPAREGSIGNCPRGGFTGDFATAGRGRVKPWLCRPCAQKPIGVKPARRTGPLAEGWPWPWSPERGRAAPRRSQTPRRPRPRPRPRPRCGT